MPTLYLGALFLALASGFCNAAIDAEVQDNKVMDNIKVSSVIGITLEVALPPMAVPVHFTCDSGSFVMPPGKVHQWSVPIGKTDKCHATWGHSEAFFVACDTNDVGHLVHWLVKSDGFFHSWDLWTWEKRASWQH